MIFKREQIFTNCLGQRREPAATNLQRRSDYSPIELGTAWRSLVEVKAHQGFRSDLKRTLVHNEMKSLEAKSYIINRFRARIEGARQFTKLMTQETDEEQVFGRPDLSSLISGQADPETLDRDPANQAWAARLRDLINNPDDDANAAEVEKILHLVELARKTVSELEGNEPRLITKGKVPDAEIVFLNELY